MGRTPGLGLRRLCAIASALFWRHWRAGQAETARHVHLVGKSRRCTAVCPCDCRLQSNRCRAELYGLGLSAVPLFISEDDESGRGERPTARRATYRLAPGPRGAAAGHTARHLGSLAGAGVSPYDHCATALPRRPSVCACGREPLLLVPGLLFVRSQDGLDDGQSAEPEV